MIDGTGVSDARGRGLALLALAWAAVTIIACAWQSDDAYITFRTASNLVGGEGLVWNPGERVQPFTSPLWMFVAALCLGISGEVYYSTLVASVVIAMASLAAVVWCARDVAVAGLVVLALSASTAVIDYSTSGLENPLLMLWLVLFVREARRAEPRLLRLALVAAALALTRLDAILFVVPVVAVVAWRRAPRTAAIGELALGFAPLVLWEMFSLVYFGSLVPNTARAKLNLEIPAGDLFAQGLSYFLDSITNDPITLIVVGLGIAAGFARRGTERLVAIGVLLYLVYIVRIGGDFMSGRFFVAPALASAALLGALVRPLVVSSRPVAGRVALGALVIYGIFAPNSRWLSSSEYGVGWEPYEIVGPTGIADERAYYYPTTGLLRVVADREVIAREGKPIPPYRGAIEGHELASSAPRVTVMNEVGFLGYFAGPEITVIDMWALTDPLLARLPFRPEDVPDGVWRIGHYPRPIPIGYRESVETGDDHFTDRRIAELYKAVVIVTRGPLFSARRWQEIWRLNTGYYDRRR